MSFTLFHTCNVHTCTKGFISSFIIAIRYHLNICILFEQRIKSGTWRLTEHDAKIQKCTIHNPSVWSSYVNSKQKLLFLKNAQMRSTVMDANVSHLLLGFSLFVIKFVIRFTSSQITNCNPIFKQRGILADPWAQRILHFEFRMNNSLFLW